MHYVQKILKNINKRCRGWLKKVNDSDRCTHSLGLRHGQLNWKLNNHDEEKMSFFEKYIFDDLNQIDAKQEYQGIGLILSFRIL